MGTSKECLNSEMAMANNVVQNIGSDVDVTRVLSEKKQYSLIWTSNKISLTIYQSSRLLLREISLLRGK